jgi:hypothetical protein
MGPSSSILWFIAVVGGTVAAPSTLSADVASGKPESFPSLPPYAASNLQDSRAIETSAIGDLPEGSGTVPAASTAPVTSDLPQVFNTGPPAAPTAALPSDLPQVFNTASAAPTAALTSDLPQVFNTAQAAPTAALTSDLPQVFNTVPAAPIAALTSGLPQVFNTVPAAPTAASTIDLPPISATVPAVPTASLNSTQGFDIVSAEATASLTSESQVSETSDLSPSSEPAYLRPDEANIQFPAQYDEAKDTRWLLYTDDTYMNEVPEGESLFDEESDMAAGYDEDYSDNYDVVMNNSTADTAANFPKNVMFDSANQPTFARIVNLPPSDSLFSAQPMGGQHQSISFDEPIAEQNRSNSSSIQPDDQLNPTISFSDQPQDLTGQSATLSNRSFDIVDQLSTASNQQAIYFDQSESDSISYPPAQSDQSTASYGRTRTDLDLRDPDEDEDELTNEEDKNEKTAAILFPSRTVSCDPVDGRGRQCCILQVSHTYINIDNELLL